MADVIITKQELIDAKLDARDLGKAANEEVIVSPRYGEDFKSIPLIVKEGEAKITQAAQTITSATASIVAQKNQAEQTITNTTESIVSQGDQAAQTISQAESDVTTAAADVHQRGNQEIINLQNAIDIAAAAGAGENGWTASLVVDTSGETQQSINNSSIYSVGSVATMLGLPEGLKNRIVQVKSTGAMYQYDAAQAVVNNGVTTLNGWVLIGYHDVLLVTLAGINGDGTNEHTKLKALLDVASTLNRPVNICGLTIHTSNIVATGNIKLVGSGGIKLFAGSNGTLLTSAYNLEIDGDIELDQNKVNNSGGTVTPESHCTIKHTGDNLILNGAKFKPSASMNINTQAKKKIICQAIEADGGQVNLYALPAATAIVQITGGEYKGAENFDNIQILGGSDVSVIGVTSSDAQRSGIVVSATTKKARIIGNLCHSNKKDYVNQGGWGYQLSAR